MMFQDDVVTAMRKFAAHKCSGGLGRLAVVAPQVWDIRIEFTTPELGVFIIRNVTPADANALQQFGELLSERSKEMFSPYPWNNPALLPDAIQNAIDKGVGHVDAHYMIFTADGQPAGDFFLWKAGGNPHSAEHCVFVPELGVAITDAHQGKGLGGLSMQLLQAVAQQLGADAIELTTAQNNEAGYHLYTKNGYKQVGLIKNPVGVDVTEAMLGNIVAASFTMERQMVLPLKPAKRQAVLDYLADKRKQAEMLDTGPA